jgi:hypothetical protein
MAILNLKKLKKPVDGQLMRAVRFEPAKHRWPGDDDQILCTLGGGNVAQFTEDGSTEAKVYLPAECGQIFTDQGIGLNELFRIQFRKTAAGAEYYDVRKLSDASEPALDPRRYPDENGQVTPFDALPTSIDSTPIERKLTTSINQVNQRKAERALETPARPQSTQQSSTPQSTPNTSNVSAPIAHTVISRIMASALCASIDATQEAERYAHSKGMELEFDSEDIRAISNTIFIQLSKDPAFVSAQKTNGGAQPWRQ